MICILDRAPKPIASYFMEERKRPWVIRHSLSLRVHYLWSVLCIERLLAHYLNRINSPEPMSIDPKEDTASSRDFPASQMGASELATELLDSDEVMLDPDELIQEQDKSTEDPNITSDLYWISEQSKHCQDVTQTALIRRPDELEKGHKPEHTYMLED